MAEKRKYFAYGMRPSHLNRLHGWLGQQLWVKLYQYVPSRSLHSRSRSHTYVLSRGCFFVLIV